jgi:polysaccharide biosynthesis protein PslH
VSRVPTERPQILFVTHLPPLPITFGGQVRIANLARLLREFTDLTLLVLAEEITPEQETATRAEFPTVEIWPQPPIAPVTGFWSLQQRRWKIMKDALLPPALPPSTRKRFEQLRANFDLVWCEQVLVAELLRITDGRRMLLDLDDLHFMKYQQMIRLETTPVRKLRAAWQAWAWRRRELRLLPRCATIGVCSADDRALLNHPNVQVIPNGYAAPAAPPAWQPATEPWLGFIGRLDYLPNRDGLAWFIRTVWPLVHAQRPDARLRVVGKIPPTADYLYAPGIEALGFVPDAAAEMNQWCAMVVPLRIGGGTRIKILEAFSRRCPVVSTTLGAYGLGTRSGHELLIGDEPQSLADQCLAMLEQPERGEPLSAAAWTLFTTRFTWPKIGEQVEQAVAATLDQPAQ